MKKAVKRFLIIILVIVMVLLVGCLVFTGNRLAGYPTTMDDYWGGRFEGKDDTMVAFTKDGAWYGSGENEIILLELVSYEEGIITMSKNDMVYQFVAIDDDTIYDEKTRNVLERGDIDDDFT